MLSGVAGLRFDGLNENEGEKAKHELKTYLNGYRCHYDMWKQKRLRSFKFVCFIIKFEKIYVNLDYKIQLFT